MKRSALLRLTCLRPACILIALVLAHLGASSSALAVDPPTVSFRMANLTADESAQQINIPVMLSQASDQAITITAAVRGAASTATAGDYALETTTLTFAPGEIEKSLRVSLVDDADIEPNETASIALVSASNGAMVAVAACTLTIIDNDDKPYVEFTKSQLSVQEGQRTLRLSARLSWPSSQQIVVPLMVDTGATSSRPLAVIPGDLGALPQAVVFPPGSTWQEIVLNITDDAVVETGEEISLELCVPGSMIFVQMGQLLPLVRVDPANLPFRLNPNEQGANCRIVISDNDKVAVSEWANTWQTATNNATRQHLRAITWTGTQYIAVGDAGTIVTSPDATAWTLRDSGVAAGLSDIAWSGTEAVAVGNGAALRSTDGVVWTVQHGIAERSYSTQGTTSSPLNEVGFMTQNLRSFDGAASIVWAGQQFVASSVMGSIATSPNGRTWHEQRPADPSRLTSDVVWTGTELIAPSLGYQVIPQQRLDLITSADGEGWTRRSATLPLLSRSWVYPYFSIASSDIRAVNWVSFESPTVALPDIAPHLAYRSGAPAGSVTTIATTHGANGSINTGLYSSTDASPFSITAAIRVDHHDFEDITWTGSQWVAIGDRIGTSADGITWSVPAQPGEVALHGITSGGGKTVAVGDFGAVVIVPEPAATTTVTLATMNHSMKDVIWASNQYVAVGSRGAILTSTDGLAWTARSSGTSVTLHSVACRQQGALISGGQNPQASISRTLVAVGSNGCVVTSSDDGLTWTVATSGTTHELRGVVHAALDGLSIGGGQFIAVGAQRTVFTSPDGLTWVSHSLPLLPAPVAVQAVPVPSGVVNTGTIVASQPVYTLQLPDLGDTTATDMLESVTWTGTQLVAVGSQDSVFTSPDGVAWTQRSISHPPVSTTYPYFLRWNGNAVSDLKHVTWTGSQLIACGTYGSVITSTDGITWTDQDSTLYYSNNFGPYPLLSTQPLQSTLSNGQTASVIAPTFGAGLVGTTSIYIREGLTVSATTNVSNSTLIQPATTISGTSIIAWPYYYYRQPETLRGLSFVGSHIIAVGSFGRVITSPDGSSWRTKNSPSGFNLNAAASHGQQTVAVGDQGLILTNTPSTSLPVVSWVTTSQTVAETEQTITLTAQLSQALGTAVDVPFSTSGSAQFDSPAPYSYPGDFGIGDSSKSSAYSSGNLHFEPGTTTATLQIQIRNDTAEENNERIIVSLGNSSDGNVQAWERSVSSIIILANDLPPRITHESADALIFTGQSHTFSVEATTSEGALSYQWYVRNDSFAPIAGATGASYTVSDTATAGERSYRVVTSNGNVEKQSDFDLIILPAGQGGTVYATEGQNFSFNISDGQGASLNASPNFSYVSWLFNGTGISHYIDSRFDVSYAGYGNRLTLDNVRASDAGEYTCRIQLQKIIAYPRGFVVFSPNFPIFGDYIDRSEPVPLDISFNLVVRPAGATPLITTSALPSGMVAESYSYSLQAAGSPSGFSARGLPPGLLLNTHTGIISGKPTVAGTFSVAVSATNANGTSTAITLPVVIAPLPANIAGSYTALLSGTSVTSFVGRLDFTVAPTGQATGKLFIGAQSYPFIASSIDMLPSLGFQMNLFFHLAAGSGQSNTATNCNLNVVLDPLTGKLSGGSYLPQPVTLNSGSVMQSSSAKVGATAQSTITINTGATSIIPGNTTNVPTTSIGTLPTPSTPAPEATLSGYGRVWSKANPATSRVGYYTALLAPAAAAEGATLPATTPRGSGYVSYTVKADGLTVLKGRHSDGSAFAMSNFIGPEGELVLFESLDTARSSLSGMAVISVDAGVPTDRYVSGPLAWFQATPKDKLSPGSLANIASAGSVANIDFVGASYQSTKALPIPGLIAPGAVLLTFSEGGVVAPITVSMTLGSRGLATVQGSNPNRAWLTFNPQTGAFSAGFNPVLGKPKRVGAQGLFSLGQDGFSGGGYFENPGSPNGAVKIRAALTR